MQYDEIMQDIAFYDPEDLLSQDFGAYAFFRSNPRRKSVLVLNIDACFAFLFDSANCKEMN